jgi:chromosome segregation ATPase
MGELEKADEARKLAFDAEGKISSPYKRKKSPPTTINNDIATNLGSGVMYDLDLKESSIAASSSSIARQTIIDQNASNDAVDYSNFVNVQHKIGSLESVRRQQRQKISQLNALNSDLDASLKSYKHNLVQSNESVNHFRNENSKLKQYLSEQETRKHQVIQSTEAKLKELTTKVQTEESEKKNLSSKLLKAEATLQKYEHDLNQTLTESAKAESLMKTRAYNAEEKVKHLETKILMESGNLNQLETSNKNLNLQLSQKSQQLHQIKRENIDLLKQIDVLMPTATNAQAVLDQNKSLEAELQRTYIVVSNLRKENEEEKERRFKLQSNYDGLRHKYDGAVRHYESVTTQLNVTKEELENVYNDLQKHMNEAEQLRPFKAKFNTIKVESDVLKNQLAESLKKFQEVEKTCEKIQKDLKRSNENIDTLTEDLEEKTNEFEKISKKNTKGFKKIQ